MKKQWEEPRILVQEFTPNEYVSACGTNGTETVYGAYLFKCDAGNKNSRYNVYLEDGTPYATSGRDSGGCTTDYYFYTPCGETHTADVDSVFLKGYMYEQNFFGGNKGRKIEVFIWTDNYSDVHCTTNLNRESWEVTKS